MVRGCRVAVCCPAQRRPGQWDTRALSCEFFSIRSRRPGNLPGRSSSMPSWPARREENDCGPVAGVNPGPVPRQGVALRGPIPQQIAWSEAPVPLGVCHSNATRPKEVLGFKFEKSSQPGAPLRNRTVDLLLTMYRSAVPHPQVDRLTCANTSTRWHSRAPDEPTRASFATQSATHFDLADEPSYEVIDI